VLKVIQEEGVDRVSQGDLISKVELIELEEEVELDFDTKDYLPENFNPYQGMDCKKNVVESLY